MTETTFGERSRVLNGASELMVLSNSDEAKALLMFGLDLAGPLDVEAMRRALVTASETFPQFLSTLTEIRERGKHRLMWVRQPDLQSKLNFSEMDVSDSSVSHQNRLIGHLAASLEKEWDLLKGTSAEFHLIRHAEKHHSFFIIVHHAAADGWTILRFLKALMAAYHEIVTGKSPPWSVTTDYASSLKKQAISLKRQRLRDLFIIARNITDSAISRPSFPERKGYSKSMGVHYAKRMLTVEETKGILQTLSGDRRPFVDLLVGGLAVAVDRWNASMGSPLRPLKICVTIQVRGRFGELGAPMNSSPIFLRFHPSERSDPAGFARVVAEKRLEETMKLADVRHFHVADTLTDALRRLPLSPRKRIIRMLSQRPIAPMLIASWGILWPEVRGGRFTKNSYLTHAGDLELTGVHALAYKPWFWCPLRLGVHTFRNRINLQLMAADRYFSSDQAESFMSLVANAVLENPFRGGALS
jgi:hypothetical protein